MEKEMTTNFKRIFFFFTLLILALTSRATSKVDCQNSGFKYIKNYSRKDYNNQSQNWSILQDKRGIIYVANQGGLMEFDGVSWREIRVPNITVRSLAIDDKGTIYIGGINEIGFFTLDSNGVRKYMSLVDRLKDNQRDFSNVWNTHSTKEGVYFQTLKFLFRWNSKKEKIKVWESEPGYSFATTFFCGGKLLFRQEKVGLMQIVNDFLKLVPGGEIFKDKKIYMIVPYDSGDKKLLIGTRSNGFYIYDGKTAKPFLTDVDNYLKEKQLSYGIRLKSLPNDFVLATRLGGLVIIDSNGKLKEIFNKTYGLQDDNVKYVFEDFQGNLWLALNKGISQIEYVSPISSYDDRYNLPGLVLSVVKHHNVIYAGTTSGLFFFASPQKICPVPGISKHCWSLLSIGKSILAATSDGVFQVENNVKQRITNNPSYVLLRSKIEPKRLWVGTQKGLVSLYINTKNSQWTKEHTFENASQEILTIIEAKKGNLWLGTRLKGVLKVDFSAGGTIINPAVTPYHTSHQLPGGEINVFMAAGHVMFATGKGIFCFDEKKKVFLPDYTLGYEFAGGENGRGVFRIVEDKKKNIWIHSRSKNFQAIPQPNGTFVINKKPFLRIPIAQVNAIYPDPDMENIWFASVDGLIRYNSNLQKNYDLPFQTHIREVVVNGMPLLYDAKEFKYKIGEGVYWKNPIPVFPYKDRNLRFDFAAPFFEGESETLYQCFLEGYDNDWSEWTSKTKKDYTNLDAGFYTFRVQAKNVYGKKGSEAAFKFRILPPWHQTWWAFLMYAVTAFFIMYLVVKWRSWKLVREKQRLEGIIKDRTKEIIHKNQQLEQKTAQLEEQAEKLKEMDKVKSRFFANISHEFRTPLTLIMGPLEQMLSKSRSKEQKKKLNLMLRNSQRLFTLINQLLELSKFDNGKVKLQACRQNIISFLKGITASFEPVVNKNQLDLTFHAEEDNITLYFDAEKLGQVILNLLSNAVKFTPPGGEIMVTVSKSTSRGEGFPPGSVNISICDNGPGIFRDQLAHIFNRFYQSDNTYEHNHKGSGIGLAIAKEIVELHHGRIDVHSHEGKGTEFIIRLPTGDAHLEPEEIVEPSEEEYEHKGPGEIPARHMSGDKKEEGVTEREAEKKKDVENIILVVEDSADVRDYIKGSLEPVYKVVEAADGREGMQKAQEIIPDLIICDIMMPELDGYELCRRLKNDITTSHIPIILLTAKASEESIIQGLETGADDYVTKPFNTNILCARIKNLIELRRHQQQTLIREIMLRREKMSVSKIDKEFIRELQEVMEKNLSEPEFNVEELKKKLCMSGTSLYRKIHALSGLSPTDFIRTHRLKRAAQLLENGFGSITEVAFEVGFSSRAYFTKCFKEKFHQLPSTYQTSEAT